MSAPMCLPRGSTATGSLKGAALLATGLLLAPSSAFGQGTPRRSATAVRVETAPRIDGLLDDEIWRSADPIGELVQVVPVEGAAPSEASEIRILYDQDTLYLGMRFYDREPDRIITTSRERDANLDTDDYVQVLFDTFLDRRNAFWFQMNAGGSMSDALVTNNGQDFNKPWDGIWDARANVDAEGWTLEIAIPFKTLNFDPETDVWGMNVQRTIGRLREDSRWSGADQDLRFFNIFEAGDLTGIHDIRQGVGLDVVPFLTTNWTNDRVVPDKAVESDPGLDAFYRITPSLTLSMTVNTDFAETEVDERQVNLTRFPLFFPERRDFFLQDAGVFEFADLGRDLIPFFSRTIGISDTGQEVPILAGAKLTGRAADYNVGALTTQIDEFGTQPSKNLSTARIARNVGEQSTVGGIVTAGNPNESADNYVYGLDANYRTSSFMDDRVLTASVFGLQSYTANATGDDLAYGASIAYPNDRWTWYANYKEIQDNFDPALGFVPRKDIRKYGSGIGFRPRPERSRVRRYEFSVDSAAVTDLDDKLQTAETELQPFGLEFQSGDAAGIETVHVFDRLNQDFDITDDVTIPAGEYEFAYARLEAETATNRVLSASATYRFGEFFDGTRVDYVASLRWRPGPLFRGELEYAQNDVDLPGGSFTTKLSRIRTNFSFTHTLSWNTFVQWDSVSQTAGINSRLRWIPKPGQDVFLVFNETLDEAGPGIDPLFQEVAFKVTYTIRF